jgi:hypothetical protein
MFVSPEEIYTHLYDESVEAISGDNERMLQMAIDAAVVEAKGYLHRFDIDKIFNAAGDDRNPLLLYWVKDIAVWHYINIANPGVDWEVRERRYNAATAWLKGVQKRDIVPDLPAPTDPDGEQTNTTGWKIGSNPKRVQHI